MSVPLPDDCQYNENVPPFDDLLKENDSFTVFINNSDLAIDNTAAPPRSILKASTPENLLVLSPVQPAEKKGPRVRIFYLYFII